MTMARPGQPKLKEPVAAGQVEDFLVAARESSRIAVALSTKPSVEEEQPRHLVAVLPDGHYGVFDLQEPDSPAFALMREKELIVHDGYRFTRLLSPFGDISSLRFVDTMLAARILDGGRSFDDPSAFDLDACCARDGLNLPRVTTGRFGLTAHDAARRALPLFALWSIQEKEIIEHGLSGVAALEFGLIPYVAEMAAAGLAIDGAAWIRHLEHERAVMQSMKKSIRRELGDINIDDDAQVLGGLWRIGIRPPSTKKAELIAFVHLPVVGDIIEYRQARDFLRNPGDLIHERLTQSNDGRIRATVHQLGAATGRLSCSSPPLMAFPKRGGARTAVVAPPGKKLVVADYVAIEMRVLADQIQDETLLELFASGRDPHTFMAARLFDVSEDLVFEFQRTGAKAINYGFLFGMGEKGFIEYARKTFRICVSEAEAARFRACFLATYRRVPEWHAKVLERRPPYKLSRTTLGRIRYFGDEDSICVKLNSPVQGTAADGLKKAILFLAPRLKPFGARIILSIHDELIAETPEETAVEVARVVEQCMKEGMSQFVRTVPIEIKVDIRNSWG